MLNRVLLNGRLPKFAGTYKQGDGQKKSYLQWCISVKRNFKKPNEKYYPEDLIRFTAFGSTADYIMQYLKPGDGFIIEGTLQVSEDYTDKNGNAVKGQLYVLVDKAMFCESKATDKPVQQVQQQQTVLMPHEQMQQSPMGNPMQQPIQQQRIIQPSWM